MNEDAPCGAVVLVSGANRGIGAAIATELLANGYQVSLGARRPETLVDAHGPETEDCLYAEFRCIQRRDCRALGVCDPGPIWPH